MALVNDRKVAKRPCGTQLHRVLPHRGHGSHELFTSVKHHRWLATLTVLNAVTPWVMLCHG
jgi:hypothetical protein